MRLNIYIPDLVWNEFTDSHYCIRSHVHELGLDYVITYLENNPEGDVSFLCTVFCKHSRELEAIGRGDLEYVKQLSLNHYAIQAERYLNKKANFYVHATENKELK
jgi:hypothetical protein